MRAAAVRSGSSAAFSAAGELRRLDERLEEARREVLERVAVRQHERAEALGVVDRDELRDRAAAVVADEHDVVEVERLEERRDDRRHAARARRRCRG